MGGGPRTWCSRKFLGNIEKQAHVYGKYLIWTQHSVKRIPEVTKTKTIWINVFVTYLSGKIRRSQHEVWEDCWLIVSDAVYFGGSLLKFQNNLLGMIDVERQTMRKNSLKSQITGIVQSR
jgi:hypothetical protein